VNDVSAASLWHQLALSSCEFRSSAMFYVEIYVKISLISIFSFSLVFNHDFFIYTDFTRIAASNTASDDVTK